MPRDRVPPVPKVILEFAISVPGSGLCILIAVEDAPLPAKISLSSTPVPRYLYKYRVGCSQYVAGMYLIFLNYWITTGVPDVQSYRRAGRQTRRTTPDCVVFQEGRTCVNENSSVICNN